MQRDFPYNLTVFFPSVDIKTVATFTVEHWTVPMSHYRYSYPIYLALLPRLRGFSCVEKQLTNVGCLSVLCILRKYE